MADQACPARMKKLGVYHSSEIPKAIYILYSNSKITNFYHSYYLLHKNTLTHIVKVRVFFNIIYISK